MVGGELSARSWRLRNWRLSTKLGAVLLIPTALALAFAGLQVGSDVSNATELARLAKSVQLEGKINDVVQQLQRERDLSVRFVAANRTGNLGNIQEQWNRVDQAASAYQVALNDARSGLPPGTVAVFDSVVSQSHHLIDLRQATQSGYYFADATDKAYSDVVQALLDIGNRAIATINQPELVRLHLSTNAIARVKEQQSQRRAVLLEVLQTGQFTPSEVQAVMSVRAEVDAGLADFRKFANADEQSYYDNTVSGPLVDLADNVEHTAMARVALQQPLSDMSPDLWDNAATVTVDLTNKVLNTLQNNLIRRTDQLATESRNRAIIDGAIVFTALLLAVLMAAFVGRSLLRPLRTLRLSALEVAQRHLPDAVDRILADPDPVAAAESAVRPVPVHTKEEVGQVARAFDAVHAEAVRLAAAQAMLRDSVKSMFVNLSRRSQTLVERQLSLIDRLEAEEQDPDQLSSLFQLDHLATRMRRNSENLLVLSGTEFGRRVPGPVPVAELLGAAVSEVEQYARIDLGTSPELAIAARAVNDLAHLIAELLDNATAFSDPQTTVSVHSAQIRTGAVAVEISDRGVGMPDAKIAEVNAQLADPPELDVGVSRRMGLFVVARLAQRHNIEVVLKPNQSAASGIIARVVIPPDLVVEHAEPSRTEAIATVAGGENGAESLPAAPAMASADIAGAFEMVGTSHHDNQPTPEQPAVSELTTPDLASEQPDDAELVVGDKAQIIGDGEHDIAEPSAPVRRAPVAGPASGAEVGGDPAGSAPRPVVDRADEPTERLLIFEEMLSQWFSADSDTPPEDLPGATVETSVPAGEPGEPPSPPEKAPVAEQPMERVWTSPADEGWQAVEVLDQPVEEVTAAGLPKRRPNAHLVPGSAPQRAAVHPAVSPLRSPDVVRGRMSSLQKGVRRGRHALAETHPATIQDLSQHSHDEEHQ